MDQKLIDIECLHSSGSVVSAQLCRQLSADPAKNAECVEFGCPSKWRACKACAEHGTVGKGSKISDINTDLCDFHIDNGEKARKQKVETQTVDPSVAAQAIAEMREREAVATPSKEDKEATRPSASPQHKPAVVATPKRPPVEKPPKVTSVVVPPRNPVVEISGVLVRAQKKLSQAIESAGAPIRIPVGRVQRYAKQPRHYFSEQALSSLGNSIKSGAQIQPIQVRQVGTNRYEIIDGERRWRACQMVGIDTVLALVLDLTNEDIQFIFSAVSNFGREEHTHLEKALALKRLVEEVGISVEEASELFGCTAAWGYQHLSLFRLHEDVLKALSPDRPAEMQLTFTVAVVLSGYDHAFQREIAKEIINKQLGINQARALIRERAHIKGKKSIRTRKRRPSDEKAILTGFINRGFKDIEALGRVPDNLFLQMFTDKASKSTAINNMEILQRKIGTLVNRLHKCRAR